MILSVHRKKERTNKRKEEMDWLQHIHMMQVTWGPFLFFFVLEVSVLVLTCRRIAQAWSKSRSKCSIGISFFFSIFTSWLAVFFFLQWKKQTWFTSIHCSFTVMIMPVKGNGRCWGRGGGSNWWAFPRRSLFAALWVFLFFIFFLIFLFLLCACCGWRLRACQNLWHRWWLSAVFPSASLCCHTQAAAAH